MRLNAEDLGSQISNHNDLLARVEHRTAAMDKDLRAYRTALNELVNEG